jgi:hypothetical protein
MHTHLEPLAIATHVTQGASTRLDQILLTLVNLFRIYGSMDDLESDVRDGIQASLDKRWAKADQDVFILTVFLNPYIRAGLFNTSISLFTLAGIYRIMRRVWVHFFREEPQYKLHVACMDYYHGELEFADEAMHLEVLEKQAKAQVCVNRPTFDNLPGSFGSCRASSSML